MTLPIRVYGRPLIKEVIRNAFGVAHDEVETKDLQMDEVGTYAQWLVSVRGAVGRNRRTDLATHLPEALVDEGTRDVEQISDDGVSLGTRGIRQTGWVAPPVLDVGVGDEQGDRQEEPFPERAKQGTHDGRRKG